MYWRCWGLNLISVCLNCLNLGTDQFFTFGNRGKENYILQILHVLKIDHQKQTILYISSKIGLVCSPNWLEIQNTLFNWWAREQTTLSEFVSVELIHKTQAGPKFSQFQHEAMTGIKCEYRQGPNRNKRSSCATKFVCL